MPTPERKFMVDTNLFIRGYRDPGANAELNRFHAAFAPFEYLSAVVAQELRAGVRSEAHRARLERTVLAVYERRGRVVTPSREAWAASGDVLAEMAWREKLGVGRVSKAFGNDILLALSCREAGMVLVTENIRDFGRIARYVPFDFVGPWPSASE